MYDDSLRDSGHLSITDEQPTGHDRRAEAPPEADGFYKFGDRIGVSGGDENVAKIQLAARWSEHYAPDNGDSLDAALQRFQRVYNYVDSVTKLIDPNQP